jgi:Schlafen, AlbA_2
VDYFTRFPPTGLYGVPGSLVSAKLGYVLSALTKPLESLTSADLDDLVQRRWPESENVEYKGELHRERANQPDAWYTGGNVSAQAKNKIFKEVVAFANTSGGRLFLGIAETQDRPPCAASIQPVPRCCKLAERLEQSIASSIDPPLTFFRVFGVQTHGNAGVVIADVSRSYNGPHRSPDLQCYVRKGTNSVPVGMRELHDIVLRLSRRQDEIQRRLSLSRDHFRSWMGTTGLPQNLYVGFRVTAVPVGAPLQVEKVFNNREVSRGFNGARATWRQDAANAATNNLPSCVTLSERPVLGGTAWTAPSNYQDRNGEKLILRDGLIDLWFKWPWYKPQHESNQSPILDFDWLPAASANVIASADAFRTAAQSPACEYGLELEILATNGSADVPAQLVMTHRGFNDPLDSHLPTDASLGPYSVGDRDLVMNLIVRDLLEGSGVAADQWPKLEIDWAASWG